MEEFLKILNDIESKAQSMAIAQLGTLVSHDTGSGSVSVSLNDGTSLNGIPLASMAFGEFSIKRELQAGCQVVVLILDSGIGGKRNMNNAVCLGAVGGEVQPGKLIIASPSATMTLTDEEVEISAVKISLTGEAKLNGKEIETK